MPTPLATRALQCWQEMTEHFHFAVPSAFVVMPDHVHGIVFFGKADTTTEQSGTFGPQRQNLASVVRGFTLGVKAWATRQHLEFVWQAGYYDRVTRDENELEKARQYILNNPTQWSANQDKPDGLFR
ncbi:transposase [Hymenobacter weizhouensis]|uniref:transposase n=1 Tax=Hymenobacter sp. YIM 151500-1 TaxID=2987689 RepID=UPI002227318A|nr:transposase [Hymenobacter sp. YIM 151500-1]